MSADDPKWRQDLILALRERNRTETKNYLDLIQLHNRLFDNTNSLRNENLQLTIENERLRSGTLMAGVFTPESSARVSQLEQKLLLQQEELTELHRRRGENAQQIIDLNSTLTEKEKILASKDISLSENAASILALKTEVSTLTTNLKKLDELNAMLRDEHTALQLAFASLEEKLRRAQDENRQLVERLIKYKAKDADKMNEENETFLKKRNDRMRRELEDAAKEGRAGSPDRLSGGEGRPSLSGPLGNMGIGGAFFSSALPTGVTCKFDAHDGEVNAVRWSPVERLVATGGADRKVKLWDVGKGVCESRGSLVGSNAGVMSVDFDCTGALILGASNDYASRVWTVADQRLRHTLTGHSGKVMAAKFLGEPAKVVTGSHDRTLKIWDLRSRACIETKFAGSSCNDLVTSDGAGSTIISGHFDKRIRFWDTRTDCSANDILLQGKVTSLDLSRDCNFLISCVRDDTIKLLDLRMNQIIASFSHENFKVGCDWARAAFSPDGTRVAAGAADGSIYIWHSPSGRIESVLRDHTSAVTAVSWHPYGTVLASVDRAKKCAIWGET